MNLPELSTKSLLETILAFVFLIIIVVLMALQIVLKINDVYAAYEEPQTTTLVWGS